MKAGRMLYSRCDGERIEMVYVDDGCCKIKVMEWPEALDHATEILNHVAQIRANEKVTVDR